MHTKLPDICTRADIERLMRLFYSQVLASPEIGFIFTDIAQMNLEHHLPVITNFWESVLLGSPVYDRNAMQVHLDLGSKVPLQTAHFTHWLLLFDAAVNQLFEGPVAQLAKSRAAGVAKIMQIKLGLPA